MKSIAYPLWPGGLTFAVTFSYDDGRIHDRRLVEILNRYGLKGTFNLNGSRIGADGIVGETELRTLYAGHEVACHFYTHPMPSRLPAPAVLAQVLDDRRRLESLAGGIVDGMAYPFGDWSAAVIDGLRACGIRYARTTRATGTFDWRPGEWLEWHPTCHDKAVTPALMESFFKTPPWNRNIRLFYIWGHSYEFDREGGWESIEATCRTLRERGGDGLWAATNGMVRDYAEAAGLLRFGAENQAVLNPSSTDVWIAVDSQPVKVPAGALLPL